MVTAVWCSPGEKDGGAGGIPGSCHSHPGQELVQGGLGNVNKGKLGGKTARASGVACRAADRAQPVRLLPRLSWAQEGALEAHPSRSILAPASPPKGPVACTSSRSCVQPHSLFKAGGPAGPKGDFHTSDTGLWVRFQVTESPEEKPPCSWEMHPGALGDLVGGA